MPWKASSVMEERLRSLLVCCISSALHYPLQWPRRRPGLFAFGRLSEADIPKSVRRHQALDIMFR
jgi:hypothetical protein